MKVKYVSRSLIGEALFRCLIKRTVYLRAVVVTGRLKTVLYPMRAR
jgi:hypothetical protein